MTWSTGARHGSCAHIPTVASSTSRGFSSLPLACLRMPQTSQRDGPTASGHHRRCGDPGDCCGHRHRASRCRVPPRSPRRCAQETAGSSPTAWWRLTPLRVWTGTSPSSSTTTSCSGEGSRSCATSLDCRRAARSRSAPSARRTRSPGQSHSLRNPIPDLVHGCSLRNRPARRGRSGRESLVRTRGRPQASTFRWSGTDEAWITPARQTILGPGPRQRPQAPPMGRILLVWPGSPGPGGDGRTRSTHDASAPN